MTNQEREKKAMNIESTEINAFLDMMKKSAVGVLSFFNNNKNNSVIMLIIACITSIFAIYFGLQLYGDMTMLNGKSSQLYNLSSYDTRGLETNPNTKAILKSSQTINDLLQENQNAQSDITTYTDYFKSLQIPYTYLLKYIYLPSLNVRKENYTDKIDIDMMGIKFLEKNPYNDIALLQRRGDYFKSLGDNNESNEVVDMSIGDFTEDENGFFNMPIRVSFIANSKRAFLLLADKLSMTSNKENISLINEFFYYLRGEIKKEKEKEIKELESGYVTTFGSGEEINQDKMIGYTIYNWIFNSGTNTLIDDDIISKTIKSIMSCANEADEVCYYKFRERYRNIPTFGYLVGTSVGTNGAENFKKFILQLPPIFAIKSFEFDKIKSPTVTDVINNQYKGTITIVVYGRSASTEEVSQIAQVLGNKCLGENKPLTIQDSIDLIQSTIVKISNVNQIDKTYGDKLRELKGIVEKLNTNFSSLTNYKKTIKLFELYRMLFDAGLCK